MISTVQPNCPSSAVLSSVVMYGCVHVCTAMSSLFVLAATENSLGLFRMFCPIIKCVAFCPFAARNASRSGVDCAVNQSVSYHRTPRTSMRTCGRGPSSNPIPIVPSGASHISYARFLHPYEAEHTSALVGLMPFGYTGVPPVDVESGTSGMVPAATAALSAAVHSGRFCDGSGVPVGYAAAHAIESEIFRLRI